MQRQWSAIFFLRKIRFLLTSISTNEELKLYERYYEIFAPSVPAPIW